MREALTEIHQEMCNENPHKVQEISNLIIKEAAKMGLEVQMPPRHLQLAVRNDEELNKPLADAQGGVLPNTQAGAI